MDSTSIIYKVHPRDFEEFKRRFKVIKYIDLSYADCFRIENGVQTGYSEEEWYRSRGYRIVNYVNFNLYVDESRRVL